MTPFPSLKSAGACTRGFTVIELMIVVLVATTLGAVAVPHMIGHKARSHDGVAQHSLRASYTSARAYYATNDGTFRGFTPEVLGHDTKAYRGTTDLSVLVPGKTADPHLIVLVDPTLDDLQMCNAGKGKWLFCMYADGRTVLYTRGTSLSEIEPWRENAWDGPVSSFQPQIHTNPGDPGGDNTCITLCDPLDPGPDPEDPGADPETEDPGTDPEDEPPVTDPETGNPDPADEENDPTPEEPGTDPEDETPDSDPDVGDPETEEPDPADQEDDLTPDDPTTDDPDNPVTEQPGGGSGGQDPARPKLFGVPGMIGLQGIWAKNNSAVAAMAGTNGLFEMGNNSDLGDIELGPGAPQPDLGRNTKVGAVRWRTADMGPWTLAPVDVGNTATANHNMKINQAAAAYYNPFDRSLNLPSGATVTLQSGVYNFCQINLGNNARVQVAPGAQVTIYLDSPDRPMSGCMPGTGGMSLGQGSEWNNPGNARDLLLFIVGHSTGMQEIDFYNATDFIGALYAPQTRLNFNNSGRMVGGIAARYLHFKNSLHFTWDPSLANLTA